MGMTRGCIPHTPQSGSADSNQCDDDRAEDVDVQQGHREWRIWLPLEEVALK